jgi:enamine deaminase RidA (YjgF/YER057c/UK114 family)
VLKIRAFVAGTGDLRRVQAIISEVFEERRLAIPVVTTVQVGALPLEGAQVVLEAIASDRKVQSEHGVLFLSGHPAKWEGESDALLESLRKNGVEASGVQQVTCFLNRVDTNGAVKARLTSTFENASINVVQTQRLPTEMFEECEAIASATSSPEKPIQFKDGLPGSFSKVAIVGPHKVALSGLQLAFRNNDEDVRRAFTRLSRALDGVGAKLSDTVFTNFYPVTRSVADRARKLRFEFYNSANPPASTLLLFEGLPSNDAILGVEAIAVVN